ncbi:hypothetical protein M514_04747 [Trichuris suis]|uniref:Brain protein I3 n=1 Tax=Trichuris suis TaxID=68888 RepID=A0A085MWT1_9BILA|nr:hypothetical protein M513_04747 [Trichuris suis]KFD61677.1 hypothetical protein M514_04747 [Trichuris suis]
MQVPVPPPPPPVYPGVPMSQFSPTTPYMTPLQNHQQQQQQGTTTTSSTVVMSTGGGQTLCPTCRQPLVVVDNLCMIVFIIIMVVMCFPFGLIYLCCLPPRKSLRCVVCDKNVCPA